MESTRKISIQTRPMVLTDFNRILEIDEEIRDRLTSQSITYEDTSVQSIFGGDKISNTGNENIDLQEVADLIDLSFVTEVNGNICGFIVGRQASIRKDTAE